MIKTYKSTFKEGKLPFLGGEGTLQKSRGLLGFTSSGHVDLQQKLGGTLAISFLTSKDQYLKMGESISKVLKPYFEVLTFTSRTNRLPSKCKILSLLKTLGRTQIKAKF